MLPLALGGAALLLVIGVIAALFVVANTGGDKPTAKGPGGGKPVDPATAQLLAATQDFARQPAVRYTRQITTAGDDVITVDLSVTQRGSTTGTFTKKGTKIGLLVVDDKTFFKAPLAYWVAQDTEAKRAARYPTQWVRVSPQDLGIDPQTLLAPDVLAAKFPTTAAGKAAGAVTMVNGVETREVIGTDETVYVSTAEPYRILRVKSTRDKFDLDTTFFGEAAVPVLFQRIDAEIQQLTLAVDSQVIHSVDGKVTLSPCGQSSCTANATINTLTTPYPSNNKATAADVHIDFTLDKRPIGTCSKVLTLPPAGKAPTACKVTYRLPADGRTHSIEAVVLATARAVLAPDIAKMRKDLGGESVAWRLRQAGDNGLPGSSDSDGEFRFVPPAGFNANSGPLAQTAGGYADADGNLWTEVPATGEAAKQNFTTEWKVKLSSAGQAKWKDKAKESKGDYFLSVTPDGKLSH
ncbi:MAG: polymorphic toxin type 17 domain-containing protein [Actinomycetota bacterium]|nr:polymorphic toxin type 17 domain-containing protein [Actinomycetota bacterium]